MMPCLQSCHSHKCYVAQDVVTRGGKMVFLYSRPGQRVLVNSRGDMIVRPSWVEASLQRLPGGIFTASRALAIMLNRA